MVRWSNHVTQTLDAVLFDMDGTLVDTEPYWIKAEYELVAEWGGTWTDEHAKALVGNALLTSAAYIREHGGVDLAPFELIDRLERRVIEQMSERMSWRPGARELLTALGEARVPCGLVTMSYRAMAMTVVNQLPGGTFTTIVTGDQVSDGKPHPEPYLTAAARLGVDPLCCVAIEDSPTGVASAEAAGCAVLAVPHHVPIPPGPNRVLVDSLTDVTPELLRELISTPAR
jgi:HAD superfamily hydrolase (TIGR01509 family)